MSNSGAGAAAMAELEDSTRAWLDGKPFAPMDNSYGVQGRLGAALYF